MTAGTCVSGANTRRGTNAIHAAAATSTKRNSKMIPNAEFNAPNQLNGFSEATNESPLARAACNVTTRYNAAVAPAQVRRKNRCVVSYS
ncbi:MAG: hypothetical protein ACKO97_11420, partial [Actinomycetota bacterium]